MRPPRVVQILPSLTIGGAEVLVSQLSEELLEQGVDCHLVLLTEAGPLMERLSPRLRERTHLVGKTWRLDARVLARTTRLLRRLRPQVVHTHLFTAKSWGVAAARLAGVRAVVHTQHGSHLESSRRLRLVHRAMGRQLSALVAVSATVTELLREERLAPTERLVEIHNGIPLGPRPQADPGAPGPLVVGALGRLHPLKGQVHLIEAMALLRQRGVQARLRIFGEGEERPRLERCVAEHGLESLVSLPGSVDDAPEQLARLHLFAQPSLSEGLPLATLEAAAAGLPLLLSDCGGMPDLIRGGAGGWLVPPGQPEALADCIQQAASLSPAQRRRLGRASARLVSARYSMQAMARSYLQLYQRVLA